ncbi:type IV pilus modification protein PilV [Lysobacteraceae bacterium NML120232]|nr:type IV pilus modification protein PilV [Xanthomonadaceae bacterium NML08-0793]PJK13770.1 type IV pilus modification protein PilV [Xanthomonadaceae bacterium NML120232]
MKTKHYMQYSCPRQQQGMGMIEVLIAVLIMAVGLLGVAALQAVALRNVGSSAERTQAVAQAYTALDMLRANRDGAKGGAYNRNWAQGTASASPDLNTTAGWLSNLVATVSPTAEGRIECDSNSVCTVGVRWDEARATGGSAAQIFEITSRLE